MKAPLPTTEQARLEALRQYEILDTDPERDFDDITLLASHICGTPVALISLVDENRQWFKSKVGTSESETSRDIAFCAHGILQAEVFVINDARVDIRFASNPLVTGDARIRFYAGAPLVTPDGHALGMLCVTDQVPRELSAEQKLALLALSRQVVAQLELRRSLTELKRAKRELRSAHDKLEVRVRQRTAELGQSNEALQAEVAERKRAEAALRTKEEHLRLAAQVAGVGTFDHDLITSTIYSSPLLLALYGRNDDDENSFAALMAQVLPEDRPGFLAALGRSGDIAGEGRLNSEYRVKLPNASIRWMHVQAQTWFEGEGAARRAVRVVGAVRDITGRKQAELELQQTHTQLLAVSRRAGMAEVATGILHNVGNVLNSVNIASTCVADSLRRSKAVDLSKVVELLGKHEKDLGEFFTNDPRGREVPRYLARLSEHLAGEQIAALKELAELQKNIEHIRDIVALQQNTAKISALTEVVQASDLLEDALRMNANSLARHDVRVFREYEMQLPAIHVEKHKVLQILVNLIRNAQQACDESTPQEKRLTLRVTAGKDCVQIAVADNGAGIRPENLARIFVHGFTTKKSGHGFGLHSAGQAAKEMGGSLSVHSDGPGQGAVFTLELPCPVREPGL